MARLQPFRNRYAARRRGAFGVRRALAALRCVKTKAARARRTPNAPRSCGVWLHLFLKDHKSRAKLKCRSAAGESNLKLSEKAAKPGVKTSASARTGYCASGR